MRPKISLLTNFIPPYRVPMFKAINDLVDLTVYVCTTMEKDRTWNQNTKYPFNVVKLKGVEFWAGKNEYSDRYRIYLKLTILLHLFNDRPDCIIIGDASFTSFITAFYCKILNIKYIWWSEIIPATKTKLEAIRKARKWCVLNSKYCLASGSESKKYLINLGKNENDIYILPNLVDTKYYEKLFNEYLIEREKLRKELGYETKDHICLYVGQFIKRKNIDLMISVFAKIQNNHPTFKLIMIGDGELKKESQRIISDSAIENIKLISALKSEELSKYYSISDVLILVSESEPWGLVINEAMCFGLPVIASENIGAAKDLIDINTGIITKRESKAIIEALELSNARKWNKWEIRKKIIKWNMLRNVKKTIKKVFLMNENITSTNKQITKRENLGKIAVLTNMLPPNRIPIFQELNRYSDFTLYVCTYIENDRNWKYEKQNIFKVIKLKGLELTIGRNYYGDKRRVYIKASIVFHLLFDRPDILLIADASLTSYIAAFFCIVLNIKYVWWNGIILDSHTAKNIIVNIRRFSIKHAFHCIAYGSRAKEFLIENGKNEKDISIFPNLVDSRVFLNFFKKNITKLNDIKNEKGYQQKEYLCLYVGQFIKRKNINLMLKTFELLKDVDTDIKLVMIGGGELKKDTIDYINKMGISNVRIISDLNQEELSKYYSIADLLILVSESEPWGLVINEAMCFGLPIIASENVGAVKDLIDVETGIVIKGDSHELKKAILKARSVDWNKRNIIKKIIRWNMLFNIRKTFKKIIFMNRQYKGFAPIGTGSKSNE